MELVIDHLLDCSDKLLGAGGSGNSGEVPSEAKHDKSKMAKNHGHQVREPHVASSAGDGGKFLWVGHRLIDH